VAQNVINLNNPVDGQVPLIGARLCNFKTGDSAPLAAHLAWINHYLKDATAGSPDAWIDIQAYASKTGSEKLNQALSDRRRAEVKASIAAAMPSARFLKEKAWGESVSGGGANDNDGYWRAVEVYAFGSRPRLRLHDPAPVRPIRPIIGPPAGPGLDVDRWFVTDLSLAGYSEVPLFGGGGFMGTITFEHVGGLVEPDFTGSIAIAGMAVGASERFELGDSTLVKKMLKALDSGWSPNLPSATAGICFPNTLKVSRLQSFDFAGDCATAFISGSFGPWGNGVYILFFGLPPNFWSWPSTLLAVATGTIGPDIAFRCKGAAVISNLGAGLSGSIGVSANAMFGRIK